MILRCYVNLAHFSIAKTANLQQHAILAMLVLIECLTLIVTVHVTLDIIKTFLLPIQYAFCARLLILIAINALKTMMQT